MNPLARQVVSCIAATHPALKSVTAQIPPDLAETARLLRSAASSPVSEDPRWHLYEEELTPKGRHRTDIVWRSAGAKLTGKYGSNIIGRLHALADFRINLAVTAPSQVTADDPDFGDRTARTPFSMPGANRAEPYAPKSLAQTRDLTRELLKDLEKDYAALGNPVDAWEAFILAISVGLAPPDWVLAYLVDGGLAIMALRDEMVLRKATKKAKSKQPHKTEAELAGQCLGFGLGRRGPGGHLAKAIQTEAEREMAMAFAAEVGSGTKPDIAYDTVAARFKVSRTTVRRAVTAQNAPTEKSTLKQSRKSRIPE